MAQKITVVDAFTDRPFAGNPAAVCILPRPADESWMKDVAREMNLSETAFLHPIDNTSAYSLRWLTPNVEVDLCGHATLAAAHVLWEEGHLDPSLAARFQTRSGLLIAERVEHTIELDFPALATEPISPPEDLAQALGSEIVFAGKTRMDLLVELPDETTLRALTPNFSSLGRIPARGVIVTAPSDQAEFDFVSRFFAPQSGIDEDPVTGSAHCALAVYWGDRLEKSQMVGYQASARGGVVRVTREGDRVKLGGQALTTLRAELLFEAK